MQKNKTVVVAGGGIAGVEAAIYAARKGFDTLLVSDRDHLFVYPLAIWIPVGKLDYPEACISLEEVAAANRFRVIVDRVSGVDTEESCLLLTDHPKVHYDYLVLAMGAGRTRLPGDEHIHSICDDPKTSVAMHGALEALVARGAGSIAVGFGGNPADGTGVRGGPAFELMFNIDTYLNALGVRDRFDLSFFAPMENPGSRMGAKPAAQFTRVLERYSIGRRFGVKIERFSPEGVHFADQSVLPADVMFFIPARRGRPEYQEWGLPVSEAGFIEADQACRVAGFDNIFAVGDAATLHGPAWRAKQGHLAEVMARTAIHNIEQHAKGRAGQRSYVHHVTILCLMDTGKGGILVYRDPRREVMLPLFRVGHALKKAWGFYYRNTKLRKIPRVPGVFDWLIAGESPTSQG